MHRHDQRRAGLDGDGVARVKAQYAEDGGDRSNNAYGYVLAG
jgi:hypothetical protein